MADKALKTGISVPTHALAIENFQKLKEEAPDALVKRLFNPLTLLDSDGNPVCKYHEVANPLQRGGASVQWHFCRGHDRYPCEYAKECPARLGFEGDEKAHIIVGVHPFLPQIIQSLGKDGMVYIDEPPDILQTKH